MFTEKLTLYIGRDPSVGLSDKDWHGVAKKKCSDQAGRFDLGCSKKREIDSRVFCLEKYCVCYVHYGHCKGYTYLGTNHHNILHMNALKYFAVNAKLSKYFHSS